MRDLNQKLITRIRYSVEAIKAHPSLRESFEGLSVMAVLGYLIKLLQEQDQVEILALLDYCEAKVKSHLKDTGLADDSSNY